MSFFTGEDRFRHEQIEIYDDGEMIFEEGDVCRDLYVVKSGRVKILKKTPSGPIEISQFSKGEFFGDISLLQSLPRYASAYAVGPTELLVLAPAGFLLKIRRDPTFAFEMLQQMSLRVKVSNDRLLEVMKTSQIPQDQVQALMNTLNGKS
ncbi:MAG: Crp/Fnr family transcriptional regulator [Bdellovibrionales bacterium]